MKPWAIITIVISVILIGLLLYSFNKINYSLNKIRFNSNVICHSEFEKYDKLIKLMKNYNTKGLFLMFFSLLIWNIDNYYCQHFIHLHAIWHFTTSLGMFYCNEIMKTYLKLERSYFNESESVSNPTESD